MRVVRWLGSMSDIITLRMIAAGRPTSMPQEQDLQRIGGIRSAQLQAVLSMTPIMMVANILNAGSILLLELNISEAGVSVCAWVAGAWCYSLVCLRKQRLIKKSGWRTSSSSRATGKVVLSSTGLAMLWAYPALFIMSAESSLETTFISITTAGMITGGALALYPVPFAAAAYACILTASTLPAVFWGSKELVLPFLIAITAFLVVVILSVRRQAGLFFLELNAKINAERQLSVAQLILDAISGDEKQVTWRCDRSLRLECSHAALSAVLELPTGPFPATLSSLFLSARLEATDADGTNALALLISGGYSDTRSEPISLVGPSGQSYKLTARPTLDETGTIVGYHGYIKNVTEQAKTAERIVKLATQDHATGLMNYQEFIARAQRAEAESSGRTTRLFLFIDADNLKAINDNFGHGAGDRLIIEIARQLIEVLPPFSLVARKGGDEFVALLPVEDMASARLLMERLQSALRSNFDYGMHKITYSCSIGASLGKLDRRLEDLELEADRALYDAKRSRHKGFRFYNQESGAEVTRSRGLINELPLALEGNCIEIFYQPIVSGSGCKMLGAEALLRWSSKKFGAIAPPDAIAAARATGLQYRLSLYVIRKACSAAMSWPRYSIVSVNMSASDFQVADLFEDVMRLLMDLEFPPARLWLEITELEAIGGCAATLENMARLRAAGIKIAIDDFGAGYSSLNLFNNSCFDVVKIDRTLVRRCDTRPNSQLILEAVRSVAQASGCIVVAEGVETASEYRQLQAMGYQAYQGFVFDRALPNGALLERFLSDIEGPPDSSAHELEAGSGCSDMLSMEWRAVLPRIYEATKIASD